MNFIISINILCTWTPWGWSRHVRGTTNCI